MNRTLATLSVPSAALLLLSPVARAVGPSSVDVELVHATWSPNSMPGLDSPDIAGKGAWRAGMLLQYERNPLILYRYGQDAGAVVTNRFDAQLGGSYDFNKWFSARLALPLIYQTGSEVEDFAADGFGLSDIRLGLRAALPAGGIFHPGAHVDLNVPSGKKEAYMGEDGVRFSAGLLGRLALGPADVMVDAAFTGRKEVSTNADFRLGSELVLNGGAILHVWPERINLGAAVVSRFGAQDLWRGGAENSLEVVGDLMIRVAPALQVDIGGGRGLVDGYGSSDYRAMASITYLSVPAPPKPKPPAPVVITRPPVPEPDLDIDEPKEKPWEEGQLARVEGLKIEIRDPILFEFGTPIIRDVSDPTLKSVASILKTYGQINHIVIEGHASEEGSYEYNYNLSTLRAQSIYNKLLGFGVHPNRMSYRGMGEVAAADAGSSEEALAADRRVSFDIVSLLDPLSPIPDYPTTIMLPWDGSMIDAPQPGGTALGAEGPPPPPNMEKVEKVQEDFFNTNDDDDGPMPTRPQPKSGDEKKEDK